MSRWTISHGSRNGGTTRIMPPGTSLFSKRVARTPFNARKAAAASPDGPAPMIATARPVGATRADA